MERNRLPSWLAFERVRPAAITGLVLFFASYAMDLLLERVGISGASTLLNDIAIGILGALLLLFYLSASYERAGLARLKERMLLVANLNRQMRETVSAIANSAMIDEREERLRELDRAMVELDAVLANLGSFAEIAPVATSPAGKHG